MLAAFEGDTDDVRNSRLFVLGKEMKEQQQVSMELLLQWHKVFQEAVQLSEEIQSLPDECECGDADAHLEGRCRCCSAPGRASADRGHTEPCTVLLTRLRADLMILWEDFVAVAGPIKAGSSEAQRLELRRGIFLTANDIQRIAEAVEHVGEAVIGFRRTCAVSEMRGLKRHCAELRAHCEQLNAQLEGQFEEGGERDAMRTDRASAT